MFAWRFTSFGDVNNGDDNSAGNHAALSRLEQVALKVIADQDQIPARFGDGKFAFLEVRYLRGDR